jgi:hypothetical protein
MHELGAVRFDAVNFLAVLTVEETFQSSFGGCEEKR